MRIPWLNRKTRAFTLVEMLVVVAIIGILAALLLPTLVRGKQRAQRIECINNLKQIGTAFQVFAHDHSSRFPMEVPQAEGGSMELVQAGVSIYGPFYFSYRHFQTLANELVVPRMLVCPADADRAAAPSFGTLQNSNVSYFVGVYADYNLPNSVLAGDRNVTNSGATPSLLRGAYGLHWTRELHRFQGNVLFSDTHVAQLNNESAGSPVASASPVLFLPTVSSSPATMPGGPTIADNSGPSATPPAQDPPAAASRDAAQSPSPNSPAPTAPQPMPGGGMDTSTPRPHPGQPSTFADTNARETNRVDQPDAAAPSAAPAANDDDYQPPLLWLLGAVKGLVTKSVWWLLLLLLLLIGGGLYYYSRRKTRERRNL